jgi:hypothetical protein
MGEMIFDLGIQYTIGKIFSMATKYFPCMFQIVEENMNVQSFGITKILILGLHLGVSGKSAIWM